MGARVEKGQLNATGQQLAWPTHPLPSLRYFFLILVPVHVYTCTVTCRSNYTSAAISQCLASGTLSTCLLAGFCDDVTKPMCSIYHSVNSVLAYD